MHSNMAQVELLSEFWKDLQHFTRYCSVGKEVLLLILQEVFHRNLGYEPYSSIQAWCKQLNLINRQEFQGSRQNANFCVDPSPNASFSFQICPETRTSLSTCIRLQKLVISLTDVWSCGNPSSLLNLLIPLNNLLTCLKVWAKVVWRWQGWS
jgi:hypothetical protein